MKAQVITTEYAGQFEVQPWQRVVETCSQAAAIEVAPAPAPVVPAPRKASDRGASAAEDADLSEALHATPNLVLSSDLL